MLNQKLAVGLAIFATAVQSASASDFEARRNQMRAEYESRRQELLRKFEHNSADLHAKQRQDTAEFWKKAEHVADRMKPVAFDSAHAPRADLCFLSFCQAARTAVSINQLFTYLPAAQQRVLKECEDGYNPAQNAGSREFFLKHNPKMTEKSLEYLEQSPYKRELTRLRDIAIKVIDVSSYKTEGNTAKISVNTHTHAVINGQTYPYGTAVVEMIGEGNYWRFSSYNDDNVYYKSKQ